MKESMLIFEEITTHPSFYLLSNCP